MQISVHFFVTLVVRIRWCIKTLVCLALFTLPSPLSDCGRDLISSCESWFAMVVTRNARTVCFAAITQNVVKDDEMECTWNDWFIFSETWSGPPSPSPIPPPHWYFWIFYYRLRLTLYKCTFSHFLFNGPRMRSDKLETGPYKLGLKTIVVLFL